jgi:hypothetical protein
MVAALSSLGGVAGLVGVAVVVWQILAVLKKPVTTFT